MITSDLNDRNNLAILGQAVITVIQAASNPMLLLKNPRVPKEIKEIKNKIIMHEKTLKRLQRKLSETEEKLNSPASYESNEGTDLHALLREQANLTSEIELNEQDWLELNEKLEI